MRLLFELDNKDYKKDGTVMVRPSVRGIIIKGGKIAMVHSLKYDYYKFPGGGIEPGETNEETLIREVMEEAGLTVIPESIREYGYVHRVQKTPRIDMFIQDNFYYLCETTDEILPQDLDDYEADEHFTLEFADPVSVIRTNREKDHGPVLPFTTEREARVLEYLLRENRFSV